MASPGRRGAPGQKITKKNGRGGARAGRAAGRARKNQNTKKETIPNHLPDRIGSPAPPGSDHSPSTTNKRGRPNPHKPTTTARQQVPTEVPPSRPIEEDAAGSPSLYPLSPLFLLSLLFSSFYLHLSLHRFLLILHLVVNGNERKRARDGGTVYRLVPSTHGRRQPPQNTPPQHPKQLKHKSPNKNKKPTQRNKTAKQRNHTAPRPTQSTAPYPLQSLSTSTQYPNLPRTPTTTN
jgi:hypothetical protein